MEIEPSPRRVSEVEGERVELRRAAQPDEAIVATLDVRSEHGLVFLARDRRDAIGRDDEIVVGGVVVRVRDLRLEPQLHAQVGRAPLQDLQERDARDAAETVTAGGDRPPLEVDINVVPVTERVGDRLVRLRIGFA